MVDGSGLKKFTGFKKRKSNVTKLSPIKATLFVLGLVVVGLYSITVAIKAYRPMPEESVSLSISDCYQPKKEADLSNVKRLLSAMKSEQINQCPVSTLTTHPYKMGAQEGGSGLKCHVVPSNSLKEEGGSYYSNKGGADSVNSPKIVDCYNFDKGSSECYPLIAPMHFAFGNSNTDSGNSIVLYSDDTKTRVTFGDVMAWFCASNIADKKTVKSHTSHGTVVGASRNSYVQRGFSGHVVGFGNENTTIKIEVLSSDSGTWESISIKNFMAK